MKKSSYLFITLIFFACNNKKSSTQVVIATPTGMQGLQNSAPAQPVNQSVKSNLIFNPEHGKPGHRCELAVGAPLNQAASTPQAQQIVKQEIKAKAEPPIVKTSAKNLNPAHGQPSHRCDIAVGAPLDSKPVAKPVALNKSVNKTTEASSKIKLNPEHGKDGHRCDIAVGAPLT
ncbi:MULTISPECIES: hypothetical protein [unclassified Pedobacter]|uniref:hypothetical protein n=1 Tax=unclassified Pedobacter TaxID=2628915 RepID=UPI001E51759E|nr:MULTISPECIES: hypothetical protein [unclassified Pedobacter]